MFLKFTTQVQGATLYTMGISFYHFAPDGDFLETTEATYQYQSPDGSGGTTLRDDAAVQNLDKVLISKDGSIGGTVTTIASQAPNDANNDGAGPDIPFELNLVDIYEEVVSNSTQFYCYRTTTGSPSADCTPSASSTLKKATIEVTTLNNVDHEYTY